MLIINIKDDLRIIATEHAWETQEFKKYKTGTSRWEIFAHNTTIINALTNVREKLLKSSKSKELVKAQADVDSLLMSSLRSQDDFVAALISLHGNEKIEQLKVNKANG